MQCQLNDNIPCLVSGAHWGLRSILMQVLKPFEVTFEQWEILHTLFENGTMSQSDLAKCLDKEQASITRMIDKLEIRKWVTRQSNNSDRRIKEILLTPLGHKTQEEMLLIMAPLQEELESFFTADEKSQLLTLLTRVHTITQAKLEQLQKGN
jgi:DNA-binding MarR family transcriptional regulator